MKKGTKSVTIDDLTIMVAKGFSSTDEKFAKIDEQFKKIDEQFTKIDKRFEDVEDNFKKVRGDILNMGDRFVPRHEFDSFLMRFHRLEQKVDGKPAK